MLYVTGDTHGGFQRFAPAYFPQQAQMTREDYVIICGDFGGLWDGSEEENTALDWMEECPFTTLFVDGNHENYAMLNALPVENWNGGKIHRVRPHILHLMRGQVYEFGGLTWFAMGGARSHDIEAGILDPADPYFERKYKILERQNARFRVLGMSWWQEELPNDAEYTEARGNLDKAGWCVDCVLTHCMPTSIALQMNRHNESDRLTDFLEEVRRKCRFAYWFGGHYHRNQIIDTRYVIEICDPSVPEDLDGPS